MHPVIAISRRKLDAEGAAFEYQLGEWCCPKCTTFAAKPSLNGAMEAPIPNLHRVVITVPYPPSISRTSASHFKSFGTTSRPMAGMGPRCVETSEICAPAFGRLSRVEIDQSRLRSFYQTYNDVLWATRTL